MVKAIEELLLVLNLKARSKNTAYTFQTQICFNEKFMKMMPRSKILKYHKNKCINQIYIFGNAQIIEYINQELKLYN